MFCDLRRLGTAMAAIRPLKAALAAFLDAPTLRALGHEVDDQGCTRLLDRYDDVWVINPGSPTYPRNLQAQPGTVGILRLEEGHRADVAIYDLKTLQPYPALTIRLE
jgi:hypothetical protein